MDRSEHGHAGALERGEAVLEALGAETKVRPHATDLAHGAAAAQSEAMCRLISLALRSGLDPRAIVDQLKGISGPNPVWDNGELILSAPDAIGRAVERYLERRGDVDANGNGHSGGATAEAVVKAAARSEEFQGPGAMPARPMSSCPDCGSPVASENGCLLCRHCGWSKC